MSWYSNGNKLNMKVIIAATVNGNSIKVRTDDRRIYVDVNDEEWDYAGIYDTLSCEDEGLKILVKSDTKDMYLFVNDIQEGHYHYS